MRLSGSMCIACLKDLEDALHKLPGIDRTRVERPVATFNSALSPDVNNWANGIVVFDSNRIPFDYIRNVIRQQGYHAYHMTDRELTRPADDHDMRF